MLFLLLIARSFLTHPKNFMASRRILVLLACGKGYPGGGRPDSVPEPTTFCLVGRCPGNNPSPLPLLSSPSAPAPPLPTKKRLDTPPARSPAASERRPCRTPGKPVRGVTANPSTAVGREASRSSAQQQQSFGPPAAVADAAAAAAAAFGCVAEPGGIFGFGSPCLCSPCWRGVAATPGCQTQI